MQRHYAPDDDEAGWPFSALSDAMAGSVASVPAITRWRIVVPCSTTAAGVARGRPCATTCPQISASAASLIDKRKLEVAKTLRPQPGKTAAHVEFTKDGRYALVSIREQDGALVIYDAQTLKEVKRLPMKKPVGNYKGWNKIIRSEGTSH